MGRFSFFALLFFAATTVGARGYAGKLEYVFADLKRPLACVEKCITNSNYEAIVTGLRANLQCNGVRIHIDPDAQDPRNYSSVYKKVVDLARQNGMKIYANPLGTGTFGKSAASFSRWIADYANEWQPDFLGPFNEAGMGASEMKDVLAQLRPALTYSPVVVGPDMQKIQGTIDLLSAHSDLASRFDVVSSHNAVGDEDATPWHWWKLAQLAGGGVWGSENPRAWDLNNSDGEPVGVRSVVETAGPVTGLVLYLAYPKSVTEHGALTEKGREIVSGLTRSVPGPARMMV